MAKKARDKEEEQALRNDAEFRSAAEVYETHVAKIAEHIELTANDSFRSIYEHRRKKLEQAYEKGQKIWKTKVDAIMSSNSLSQHKSVGGDVFKAQEDVDNLVKEILYDVEDCQEFLRKWPLFQNEFTKKPVFDHITGQVSWVKNQQ